MDALSPPAFRVRDPYALENMSPSPSPSASRQATGALLASSSVHLDDRLSAPAADTGRAPVADMGPEVIGEPAAESTQHRNDVSSAPPPAVARDPTSARKRQRADSEELGHIGKRFLPSSLEARSGKAIAFLLCVCPFWRLITAMRLRSCKLQWF